MTDQKLDWESIISLGLEARENKDNGQWLLGDLALQVEKNYGQDSIGKFAIGINEKKTTIMRYRTVSRAWSEEQRIPYLSHRHHQIIASRKDRLELINQANDSNWTVEDLSNHVKKLKGQFDNKLRIRTVTLSLEEIELILDWHDQTNRDRSEDLQLSKKMESHSKAIKQRIDNNKSEED
jgi:hypothetical protein